MDSRERAALDRWITREPDEPLNRPCTNCDLMEDEHTTILMNNGYAIFCPEAIEEATALFEAISDVINNDQQPRWKMMDLVLAAIIEHQGVDIDDEAYFNPDEEEDD